jgi:hypothetical protein
VYLEPYLTVQYSQTRKELKPATKLDYVVSGSDNINADVPHETRQMTTAEYYCRAGYKKRTDIFEHTMIKASMVNLQWHSLNPNYKASKLRTYKSKPSR